MSEAPVSQAASTVEIPFYGSRDRARSARRNAILEAAERVFAERGFRGATMAEIARRAGYSAGNLYNVFENKEALFGEVLTSRASQFLEAMRTAVSGVQSIGELIDRYVDVILSFVREHRGFFVIITQTHLDFDWHEPRTRGALVRDEFDADLEQLFAAAIERGELPPGSSRSYVCLVQGTLNSLVARWARNGDDPSELDATADELRTLLKRALGV